MSTAWKSPAPGRPVPAGYPPPGGARREEPAVLGRVQIHNNVVAVIARLAALRVPGVVELGGSFADGLAGLFSRKTGDRGIRVEVEDASVSIEMNLVIEYGVRIPEVAWRVQTEVRRAVEQMTGKAVREVNVVIQNVRLPEGGKAAAQEEYSA